jgi:hypothetical protein
MSKEELLKKLNDLSLEHDWEHSHYTADSLLIEYINDPDIEKAFINVGKWYA